jgi:hypothetical protein
MGWLASMTRAFVDMVVTAFEQEDFARRFAGSLGSIPPRKRAPRSS